MRIADYQAIVRKVYPDATITRKHKGDWWYLSVGGVNIMQINRNSILSKAWQSAARTVERLKKATQ